MEAKLEKLNNQNIKLKQKIKDNRMRLKGMCGGKIEEEKQTRTLEPDELIRAKAAHKRASNAAKKTSNGNVSMKKTFESIPETINLKCPCVNNSNSKKKCDCKYTNSTNKRTASNGSVVNSKPNNNPTTQTKPSNATNNLQLMQRLANTNNTPIESPQPNELA
jgi:hypothetical protein